MAPLTGIKVLELSNTVAGPAAGRLLADFGATVIKVEPPGGDHLRTWGELAPDGTSWWFKSHNRNKEFIKCDLGNAEDREHVERLALTSDVIIENFRPKHLEKWNLGYEQLSKKNPRLVYVSISGFGQDGPYSSRPGFGHIAESLSGLRYLTGYPELPPVRVGLSIGDEIAALYAVIGTMMALKGVADTGRGDFVDVSLLESLFSLTEALLPEYVHTDRVGERSGNRYQRAAPSNIYTTADGEFLSIAANSEPIFRKLCDVMGMVAIAEDQRFSTNQARVRNAADLDELVQSWVGKGSLTDRERQLVSAGIPASPVYSIADIVSDPQFQFRGAIASVPDETGLQIATPGIVPRLRNQPGRLSHAARPVGADNSVRLHQEPWEGDDVKVG